jgi:hypothetical protein
MAAMSQRLCAFLRLQHRSSAKVFATRPCIGATVVNRALSSGFSFLVNMYLIIYFRGADLTMLFRGSVIGWMRWSFVSRKYRRWSSASLAMKMFFTRPS